MNNNPMKSEKDIPKELPNEKKLFHLEWKSNYRKREKRNENVPDSILSKPSKLQH